jgi:hypothetical protein
MVAFAIFAGITLTRAPQVPSVTIGLDFIKELLLAFLFGFTIATGVSLFILPITNRRNFFMGTQKYAATIEAILGAQKDHVRAHHDHLARQSRSRAFDLPQQEQPQNSGYRISSQRDESKANRLKSAMISLIGIHDNLHGDLVYAKNEIAWGKLTASDLEGIFSHLRSLFLPLAGLSMLPDVFQTFDDDWRAHRNETDTSLGGSNWKCFSQPLMEELNTASSIVTTGVQHALLLLEITHTKASTRWFGGPHGLATDVESTQDRTFPGNNRFASYLQEEINKFVERQKDLHVSLAASETAPTEYPNGTQENGFEGNEAFFVFLFSQHLFRTLLQATLELVRFADGKIADKTMESGRLIFPQGPFIKAWLTLGAGSGEESGAKVDNDGDPSGEPKGPIDPEHLPPANLWERSGNVLRYVSQVLASDQSVFGFRAAAASFSVAILAFLHQTQDFFKEQRLIWALIVIAFGMSPTSGAGLFSFAGRVLATIASIVLSLIVWYIVDGHVPGVIIFLYLANVFEVKYQPALPPPHVF